MRRIVPAALVLLALVPQACQRDEPTAPQLPRPRAQAAAGSECANPPPGTIWCDDFEVDRLSSYFEHLSPSSFARTAGVGLDGSAGMRVVYTPGVAQAGDLKVAFGRSPDPAYVTPVDGGTSDYRDIYWRAYLKNQAGWTGGGAGAFTKAMVLASPDWAQAAVGYVVAPGFGDALRLDPVSGTDADGNLLTTGYNDFDHFTWLGNATGATPIFGEAAVGQWYCIEAHMRLNDAGQSNGILEYWINGTLDAQRTGLNFLGSYSAFGINAIFFENYWSATAPQPEERYWDNIVVATQRIGCGPSGPPPPTFTTVSVGVNACALTDGGAAYCWGEGGNNGDGTTTFRPTPVPVEGGFRWTALTASSRTCGLSTSGAVYCWGLTPQQVASDYRFTAITNGCGLTTEGVWYCWNEAAESPLDTEGHDFTVLSMGSHSCGVTTAHAAYCKGVNSFGALGDGTYHTPQAPPWWVAVTGGLSFSTVSAGSYNNTCGVTTSGAGYCWGYDWGATPSLLSSGVNFTSISTGWTHACGVATSGDGYCWGESTAGELGHFLGGSAQVVGGHSWKAIGAGRQWTCGVTTDGALYCWGNTTTGRTMEPVQVVP